MPQAPRTNLSERYGVPPGLERHPLNVIWWCFLALPVYMGVVGLIISQIAPDVYDAIAGGEEEIANDAALWMAIVLVELVVFWRLTRWTLKQGFGTAAGSLDLPPVWVVVAVVLSLIELWFVPIVVDSVFQPAEENWVWRDPDEAAAFMETALTGAALASIIIMAPVIEEITFRGLAMGWMLSRGVPPAMTLVVTSAAFALAHTQYTPLGMISIFTAGLLYGWLRLASGTVSIPIIAHMTANAAVVLIWNGG